MASIDKLIEQAGKNLSAKEIREIQEKTGYTPESIINRAEKADVNVTPAAQSFVQQFATQQTQKQEQAAQAAANPGTQAVFSYSPAGSISSVSYAPIQEASSGSQAGEFAGEFAGAFARAAPNSSFIGYEQYANVQAALQKGQIDTQKQLEQLRQAGQTERQKLVNENNLAVTGMEVKGKLDLQAIVNAGYKNIANIERGSNMFSNIMSAFNF
jgi:hypothetical protein